MGAALAPGITQLSPEIIAAILDLLKKQDGGIPGFPEFDPKPKGPALSAGTSPIVPSNPDQGIPRDPSIPNPGQGGNSGIGAQLGGGIGAAFGGPVGAGIGSAVGGLGEALLLGGNKKSKSVRGLNDARAGQARSQSSALNSRALQELMQILLRSSGRGGL